MDTRPTCVDCRKLAPDEASDHSLISASFGWRLTRKPEADGRRSAEWRCPECWAAHRGRAPSMPEQPPPSATLVPTSAVPGPPGPVVARRGVALPPPSFGRKVRRDDR